MEDFRKPGGLVNVILSGDHTIRLQVKLTAQARGDVRFNRFSSCGTFSVDLVANEAQRYFIFKHLIRRFRPSVT